MDKTLDELMLDFTNICAGYGAAKFKIESVKNEMRKMEVELLALQTKIEEKRKETNVQ